MHACRVLLAWFATSAVSFGACRASPYDPHVPGHAPWFEGWYTRVIDRDSDLSFGAMAGYFPNQTLTEPSTFAGILYAASRANLTQAYQHLPPSITLTDSDGTPVHKQPSKLGQAHFALHTADKSCNLTAKSTAFEMSVMAGDATLTVKGDSAGMPWGPGGETPEGAHVPCASFGPVHQSNPEWPHCQHPSKAACAACACFPHHQGNPAADMRHMVAHMMHFIMIPIQAQCMTPLELRNDVNKCSHMQQVAVAVQ